MTKVDRPVIGLRHRPQGGQVDQLGFVPTGGIGEQLVQMRGLQNLPLGQRQARGLGGVPQAFQFVCGRFFVDAEQQRRVLGLQRFSGGHVGQNHELFNQLVGIQTIHKIDRGDLAVFCQHDPAFRQIKVQRLATFPCHFQRPVRGVKRLDHIVQHRGAAFVRIAVHRGLHLLIGQGRWRPHQAAHKLLRLLMPVGIDDHPNSNTGARHAFVQRTQIA